MFRKGPAGWAAYELQFLCEQDGPMERDLKAELVPILEAYNVARAYLVLMEGAGRRSVGLCLAAAESQQLVARIGRLINQRLSVNEFLDILFIRNPTQEDRIARVSKPFYIAA